MNNSEKLVYNWLNRKKWHPVKSNDGKGEPDFKCNKDRWVEVKSINGQGLISNLSVFQITCWNELIKNGNKVYLMIVSNKKIFEPMDVTEFNFLEYVSIVDKPKTNRITVRLWKKDVIKSHAMKNMETFNKYINRLIDEDILKTGDTETVIGYFDKEEIPR